MRGFFEGPRGPLLEWQDRQKSSRPGTEKKKGDCRTSGRAAPQCLNLRSEPGWIAHAVFRHGFVALGRNTLNFVSGSR